MKYQSCIYQCEIWHERLLPKKHQFSYKTYMFWLDIDEIDTLDRKLLLFNRNRFNLFNFRDKDHLQLSTIDTKNTIKTQLTEYLAQYQILASDIGSIKLLTNVATAGYIFNPVCFYYVFDRDEKAICAIVEVRNTFMELKPYFLEHNCWDGRYFGKSMQKYFYVSPFIAHDAFFHFQLGIPNQALDIKINDRIEGQLVLKTALNGKKAPLNDQNLLFFFITMPFITLQIIFSIHWQALRLYLKGLPYFKKDDHLTLQRDLYKP